MESDQAHHLLFSVPFPEPVEAIEELRKRHPQFKITFRLTTDPNPMSVKHDIPDELWSDVTILTTVGSLPHDPALAPKLKLIQILTAGVNHVAANPLIASPAVPLANCSGVAAVSIAEWTALMILVLGRQYNDMREWQQAGTWGPPERPGHAFAALRDCRDSVGQRIGVLGYGAIGRQTARLCHALGMTVLAHTASPRPTPGSRRDRTFHVPGTGDPEGTVPSAWFSGTDQESVRTFLAQDLDVLMICLPLGEQSRGIIGKAELAILGRRNALLVNVARGAHVDQDALIDALREYAAGEGKEGPRKGLRGAALDVTDPEPPPRGHPLWTTPNCVVTPHVSAISAAYFGRTLQLVEENLTRFEEGTRFVNLVDRGKGYASFE